VSVNRWAGQQLATTRSQLEQDHRLYRSDGEAPNPISAAMNWIDDRLIDQRIAEQRQQIHSTLLRSSRCLVQFEP